MKLFKVWCEYDLDHSDLVFDSVGAIEQWFDIVGNDLIDDETDMPFTFQSIQEDGLFAIEDVELIKERKRR